MRVLDVLAGVDFCSLHQLHAWMLWKKLLHGRFGRCVEDWHCRYWTRAGLF